MAGSNPAIPTIFLIGVTRGSHETSDLQAFVPGT